MIVLYEPLDTTRLSDVACCPGGLELAGKRFRGDLSETLAWRQQMFDCGMRGVIAYDEAGPRGFAEYAPAEVAPVPIVAPEAAVLMCYHWAGTPPDDPEHLAEERKLIEHVVDETRSMFAGLATQGWDISTHFPIPLLEEIGFHEVDRRDPIALMWLPFDRGTPVPRLVEPTYAPRDLSPDALLAIDAAFSARCPYSIHGEAWLRETVANHPLNDRIRLAVHRIDTRADALAYAVPPFNWDWIFLNGDEVSLFELPGEALSAEIARRIESLP